MRRTGVAVAVALLTGGVAAGQLGPPGSTNNLTPAMPGQVVGNAINLKAAGAPVSQAVPSRADIKKLESPTMRAYDPSKPYDVFRGTNIDPTSVVAPVPNVPGSGEPNMLQRLYTKLGTVTGFITPSAPPTRTTYTPGISRRNKERAMQRTWRKD